MPSKPADARYAVTRRVLGAILGLVVIACGWCHGVLYVEGGSMQPALDAGDVIVYRRYGAAPRAGELVVFEHRGGLVVHRVAAVMRDGRLRTRGDANSSLDGEPVDADSVRGTVALVVPSGRLVSRLVASAP
jgi:signal peptidase I